MCIRDRSYWFLAEHGDGGVAFQVLVLVVEPAAEGGPGAFVATAHASVGSVGALRGWRHVAVARSPSRAVTLRDGRSGVKSGDALLQTSPEEIMLFMQTHNTRKHVKQIRTTLSL